MRIDESVMNDITRCIDGNRTDEGVVKNALAALILGSSMAMADPVDFVKGLEGSVKDKNGQHITYDDATGKKAIKQYYCAKCKAWEVTPKNGKCSKCGKNMTLKWKVTGTPTIGYGVTDSSEVNKRKMSDKDAVELLKTKLKDYEAAVDDAVTVDISQNQKDALTSFCYNVGISAFKNSDLVKKINDGKSDDEIRTEWRKWNKSRGKENEGLKNRREKEIEMFFKK